MASLKETKGRIASVKSTLKITSAMKMVASAKLHKAQNAILNMTPYERKLREILSLLMSSGPKDVFRGETPAGAERRVVIVAFASNSSLCGGFNGNAIRETRARIAELEKEGYGVEVVSVGKKMGDAMKRLGYPSAQDWSDLLAHPSYECADTLARLLQQAFNDGKCSRVELIYNHFVSTARQEVVRETYLPAEPIAWVESSPAAPEDLIIEPSVPEMIADLLPRVRSLRIYTVVLDCCAAEHAARTIAMQTATDNGENILQDLTLEYNKGRQQKITSEILDIVGGSMQ